MKKIILAAVAVAGFSTQAALKAVAKFDPPDMNLEYQLHRQFLKSNGRQGNVYPLGSNESYSLQKGETLWTLSEMLYGDGQYWPRVWAQNKGIANPHLVRPGHQLQFMMGSEDDTPAFRFSEDGDEASGVELAAGPSQNPIVEIPPPEIPPKPILKVPNSFPEWQNVFKKKPDQFLDDRGIVANRLRIPDRIFLRGYVQEKSVEEEAVGMFMENDNEAGLPITNQYVYVKVKKGMGHAGMKMLVVANGGQLKRLNRQWDPDERPWLVQITAEVELRESVPARFRGGDREKYDAYRALVTQTTGLSAKECFLIPGQIKVISLEKNGSSGTVEAQVIGSEKHGASALFSPGDLVFLNKGASDGLEAGQLLDVFADRTIRRREAIVTHSPVISATIKVVKTSNNVATAVLLSAFDSVQQGDVARQVSTRHDGGEELESFDMKGGPSAADDELAPEDGGSGLEGENFEDEMESGGEL